MMIAMNYECCQNFAGPHHDLNDFHRLLSQLVARENTQYSYQNTRVALTDDGKIAGICTSYDGGRLHELRQAFIDGALEAFGMDFSNIDDETQAGELYIDCLCVDRLYQGHGIATQLLQDAIQKTRHMGLPQAGLLVDMGNPNAERLYKRIGFVYKNDASWGGHPMRHFVYDVSK